jgi:sugar O-acyltransferase (sialic acid O-acetyltransferase NeuD family)
MKPIIVYGAGGAGREIRQLIADINAQEAKWEFRGFVVTDLASLGERDSREDVVGDEEWLARQPEGMAVAIGIGTPKVRRQVAERLRENIPDLDFPNLLHPTIVSGISFEMGVGNLVGPGNIVGVQVSIGDFNYLNSACTIGHDVRMGSYCVVNPGSNTSGGVELGDAVLLGANSTILQYRKIGKDAIVAAGALVNKDVPEGITVMGVPARVRS